jgi:hypothetical protein
MFRQFRKIEKGEFIVAFGDTAVGGPDRCACPFMSTKKLDFPLLYHSKVLATEMTNSIHPVLEKISDVTGIKPVIAYERNNGGVFEMERLATLNRNGKYEIFKMPTYGNVENADSVKLGWDTNTATRPKMLSDWKEAIDKQIPRIYDRETITEHFSFIVSQTSSSWKAQAEKGAHDDLVVSYAGCYQLYQICKPPVSNTYMETLIEEVPDSNIFDGGFY